MERLTFYNDRGSPVSRRGWEIALAKLAEYEDAEEKRYIVRCGKCKSLNLEIDYDNRFVANCKSCGHSW